MKQQIYLQSPFFIKNIIASAYGRTLYKRRYQNKYFAEELPEIIERQRWGHEQLRKYQLEKLKDVIAIATKYVPYYRDLFRSLKIRPEDIRTIDDFVSIFHVLEKSQLREKPGSFVDKRIDIKKLYRIYTSGTTGTPLCIYRDDIAEGLAYAYFEGRWRMPYGITKESSWAILGGKVVVPQNRVKPPFWIWNSGLNQLYMSSYHLSIEFGRYYLEELRSRRLDYIYGYASSLYSLALFAHELNFDGLTFKVAISNAEPLYNHQRKMIEKVFKCRTVDTYGCTEWCFQASECSEGKMHISPDVGLFETVDSEGVSVPYGEIGEVVCTGFLNFAQPLIRYRTGDSARLSLEQCSCGSSFLVLESVEGRNDDLITLGDGRRIGRLDPVFKGELPLKEAQIIQNSASGFTIKVVPMDVWNEHFQKMLIDSFTAYVGNVDVMIDVVDSIDRTPSGKFKAVINNMTVSQK